MFKPLGRGTQVTILAFLCCSAGGGNVRSEDAAAKKRQ